VAALCVHQLLAASCSGVSTADAVAAEGVLLLSGVGAAALKTSQSSPERPSTTVMSLQVTRGKRGARGVQTAQGGSHTEWLQLELS
jgi:hypothetical protein